MSVIRRLFRSYPRPARRPEPVLPAPLPDECLLAVGDIHGRLDLLDRLLAFRKTHFPLSRLIVLGDMIDRGPRSAGVLDRLQSEDPANAVCILGNHEQMLLDALDDPARLALSWLRAGGLETAWSYGLTTMPRDAADAERFAADLRQAIGAGTVDWLRSLPLSWRSGNLVAVHAALDPALPPELQTAETMLWGRPAKGAMPRPDGLWVAHGHTIVDRAFCQQGRIALDTGAYATGRLSYALIDPGRPIPDRVTIGIVPDPA